MRIFFLAKFSKPARLPISKPDRKLESRDWRAGEAGWILQNGSTSVKFLISALLSGIYTISIVSMRRWGNEYERAGAAKVEKLQPPCNIDFRDEYRGGRDV